MNLTDEELDELEYLLDMQESDRINSAWHTGDLSYKLHAGQRIIWDTLMSVSTQEAMFLISRQWGKSYLSCVYAICYCIKNPGSIVRIAAPKLKQAMDIVQDNLNPICRDAPDGFVQAQRSSYRWRIGQSELRLGILERAHIDTMRGGNAKLIICEEGGFVSSDDYAYALRSVIAPQLLHSKGQLFHVTTPSEEPDHYIHTEVMPKCAANGTLFEYDIYTNPRLDADQIERAAQLCGGKLSAAFQREYLCKIIRDATRVCVPEFSMNLVQEYEQPEFANWMTVGDWGGIRDKTAILSVFWDFRENKLVFWDELFFDSNTPTDTIVQELQDSGFNTKKTIMDAPGQLLVDIKAKYGINAILPNKDDWMAAVNMLRIAIVSNAIVIHPRCKWLIQTLTGATFNRARTDLDRTDALGHMDMLMAAVYANRMVDRITNPWPATNIDWKSFGYSKETLLAKNKQTRVSNAFLIKGRK